MSDPAHGYVTDILYTRGFFRELAPAWLDFTATLSGIAPPTADATFAWCELGCGQGVSTVVLAATHPRARFVGIDLMPEHIAHARHFAAEAGVTNATFHAADFANQALELPQFDYIAAHGVYAWIDAAAQAAMRRLIDRRLKPGGLLYLSYNAMPGWAAETPFQRLVAALGRGLPGDSAARFLAASEHVRRLAAAGAPSLGASRLVAELDELIAGRPPAYLAHEYMASHSQPLYVTEVRAAMAPIGLIPAGSAVLADNFDSFVLRRPERAALEAIDDPDARELARDFLLHQRFRRDVFSRGGGELGDDERRERILATRYALALPAENVAYRFETGAGDLAFDNDTARAIVARLAAGPRRGAEAAPRRTPPQDVVANLMALCSAGMVLPVSPDDVSPNALNDAIFRRVDGPEAIDALALSCGTAVRLEPAIMRALKARAAGDGSIANWSRYLAVHAAG